MKIFRATVKWMALQVPPIRRLYHHVFELSKQNEQLIRKNEELKHQHETDKEADAASFGKKLEEFRELLNEVISDRQTLTRELAALSPGKWAKDADEPDTNDEVAAALKKEAFCILPWSHSMVTDAGWIYPCCHTSEFVQENGRAATLYEFPLSEIRNSSYMRQIRRDMVAGKRPSICSGCYANEEQFGTSVRIWHTKAHLDREASTVAIEKAKAVLDDYRVAPPSYLHLTLTNLCNLACRMCFAGNSSKIEHDKVHRSWAPTQPTLYWSKDNLAKIGPYPNTGLSFDGFHPKELQLSRDFLGWTNGNGSISLPLVSDIRLKTILIEFSEESRLPTQVEVIINGTPAASLEVNHEVKSIEIDMNSVNLSGDLCLEILSPIHNSESGARELGVAVKSVCLTRHKPESKRDRRREHVISRLPDKSKIWSDQEVVLFGEVLANPHALRRLNVTGGEPLLHKQYYNLIKYLIAEGCAENIVMALNTNCTILPEDTIERLSAFKRVEFNFSLDAAGASYDYIRYPATWEKVRQNVLRVRKILDAVYVAVPVLQLYNAMTMHELAKWCDEIGLKYQFGPLSMPAHLAVSVMPLRAREIAAGRLLDYAKKIHENAFDTEHSVMACSSMANFITANPNECDPEMVKTFMAFTNDLDSTRNQDFCTTYPELAELFAEEGFPWSRQVTRYTPPVIDSSPIVSAVNS